MHETQTPEPFNLDQAAQASLVLSQQFNTLVANWQAEGRPSNTTYPEERDELRGIMSAQAESIFSATGVEDRYYSEDMQLGNNLPTAESRLKLATDVAEEASTLGFSLEVDDQSAIDQAHRLIEDFKTYTEPLAKDRNTELPADYSKRSIAKRLLLESSARDIARRIGIDEPSLDPMTIDRIKAATGIAFDDSVRVKRFNSVPSRRQEDDPNYMGERGKMIYVQGMGFTAIEGYRYGNPVVRGKDGLLLKTHGRY